MDKPKKLVIQDIVDSPLVIQEASVETYVTFKNKETHVYGDVNARIENENLILRRKDNVVLIVKLNQVEKLWQGPESTELDKMRAEIFGGK